MNSNVISLKLKPIKKPLKTPKNLKKSGKKLWESVVRSFNLEEHDLVLLRALCECADRNDLAQEELVEYGSLTFKVKKKGTKEGEEELKPHPAVAIIRDCCVIMSRLRRELGLSEPAEEAGRQGCQGGNGMATRKGNGQISEMVIEQLRQNVHAGVPWRQPKTQDEVLGYGDLIYIDSGRHMRSPATSSLRRMTPKHSSLSGANSAKTSSMAT